MRRVESPNVHVISFRVNSEERKVLLDQARKTGVSLSQLLRAKMAFPGQGQKPQ